MIKITLRNYRAFGPESPAEFVIGDGFTAFVGRNNAGKSTCIRALFELREVLKSQDFWNATNPDQRVIFNVQGEPDPTILLNFGNDAPAFVTIDIGNDHKSAHPFLMRSTLRLDRDGAFSLSAAVVSEGGNEIELRPPFRGVSRVAVVSDQHIQVQLTDGRHARYSDHIFRTALQKLTTSVYYGPYRNAVNEGANKHYDMAVGTAVVGQWDHWKAGPTRATQKAISRVEADIKRLLGYQELEINASSDNKTLNVKVDGHPFQLGDLGAGVAELVMTLSNALVSRPPFIFIDEPENHLHPSLQVDFLTTLASYASDGIAFSTHSIGLARTIADRVYAVVRNTSNEAQCRAFEKQSHLAELLGSLSYSGYFPLEFANVLLVEGASDVRTFQLLLRKLKKDHSFVILPLGGSQLIRANSAIELGEVIRVAGSAKRVFAVVDSESAGPDATLHADRLAFSESCSALGITCHITSRRATENYFSELAVKSALGPSFSGLTPYQLLREQANGWSKSENWRIANCEDESFFAAHDLGKFLSDLPKSTVSP